MQDGHDDLAFPFTISELPRKSVGSQWEFLASNAVMNKEVLTLGIAFVLGFCVLNRAIGLNLGILSSVRSDKGNDIPNGPIGLSLIGKPTNIHLIYLFTYTHTVQDRSPF